MRKIVIPTACLTAVVWFLPAFAAAGNPLSRGHWLGPDNQPLPFRTDEEVLSFLSAAEVVASQDIPGSSNRPRKLTLELDGVRAHAIFRTVDVEHEAGAQNVPEHARGFRDNYRFEVAAYRLSRLLGLDNVPPAVVRKIGREEGSLQLWVEQAMGVADRLEQGVPPAHEQLWLFQKQNMVVFDNLIYNFDRNPGNILIDAAGKVWFVDHTRAFKILPSLSDRGAVKVLERRLWDQLRGLDPQRVRAELKGYLRGTEIDALLKRHKKLVRLIERRIVQHGAQAILFEFVDSAA